MMEIENENAEYNPSDADIVKFENIMKLAVRCDICGKIFSDRAEAKQYKTCMTENNQHSVSRYKL